ncbi:hypothetical protein FRC02_000955 [Tulasnella sp. 418]|nr:hypothetical protein FRC02_000955 [Tulasnella sp. 418]
MKLSLFSVALVSWAAVSVSAAVAPLWGQCGGQYWSGPTECDWCLTCDQINSMYSVCVPASTDCYSSLTSTATATPTP